MRRMLPLVGQKLALQNKNLGTSLMSACIVAAQIVMVPMAILVGAKADAWVGGNNGQNYSDNFVRVVALLGRTRNAARARSSTRWLNAAELLSEPSAAAEREQSAKH